ncbi:2-C-methyl-D-erythritol 2,4-cyclodiphosphate synthase [Pseudohaliea rubra]|uniref:2-C-methyl-D-erythritol 2,4-cyclodiphosphate synthase n=1 Tax=Pseudohaliea rubra DSM 19751 TaxID=1265313 RepID=A0A095VVI6_9GAMM|nr:2-C-methyl-D-erythritol 2,4-cyclodiphosphate synthase [Pseudohaliea rubra]KGE05038.1 2-C-methyl-D-erythritol 2,4-cyclodiphosphate synthase [Pseudohaliea rubra DSM 19751]
MRIGHGYDVHRFCDGDHVILGGVRIDHEQALAAHSDGDVVLHALCDALLGAIGAGDIGRHFPDDDAAWAGADSRDLLRRVMAQVQSAGFLLGNADLTVIAQAPRLAMHIPSMIERIAADCAADLDAVNVKATTTEGLGFCGRREGIAAHAVVLLVPASP